MKNLIKNSLTLLAVSSMIFLYSCGDDDTEEPGPVGPSITLSGDLYNQDEFEVGDSVGLSVAFSTPGELSGFNYQVTINKDSADEQSQTKVFNSPEDIGYTDTDVSGSFNFTLFEEIPENLEGKSVTVYFEIVDKADQLDSVSWTFEVFAGINTYEMVLLGAQNNSEAGFYDADANVRFTYAQARDTSGVESSVVDLAYYWGATNENTLAAIDDAGLNAVYEATNPDLSIEDNFGTRNSTRFVKLEGVDFDDVQSSSQLINAASFESTTAGESSATMLEENDVVAFQLDADRGGKFGLIKIASIDDTNGNGTITIEVKIGK